MHPAAVGSLPCNGVMTPHSLARTAWVPARVLVRGDTNQQMRLDCCDVDVVDDAVLTLMIACYSRGAMPSSRSSEVGTRAFVGSRPRREHECRLRIARGHRGGVGGEVVHGPSWSAEVKHDVICISWLMKKL